MGKEVLPVRLDREIIDILEEIVKAGFFPDKSKAARELLKLGLEKFNEDMMARISSLVDIAIKIERDAKEPAITVPKLREMLILERDRW